VVGVCFLDTDVVVLKFLKDVVNLFHYFFHDYMIHRIGEIRCAGKIYFLGSYLQLQANVTSRIRPNT
jgi:hypothetical protein